MEARMGNPATVVPGAMKGLLAIGRAVTDTGLSEQLVELVNLRASQINGCSVCVDMHARALRKAGESDERLSAVAAWREAPYFTDEERAALALAEGVTRLSDRAEAVSDEVWNQVADHFDEQQLGALILGIASVNLWNRLNAATKQVAGAWG